MSYGVTYMMPKDENVLIIHTEIPGKVCHVNGK